MPIPPVAKFTTPLLRYMSTRPSADNAISDPAPKPSNSSVMSSTTSHHRSDETLCVSLDSATAQAPA